METITMIWPIIGAGFIVPMAAWLKKKLPTDFPIQSVFIVSAMSIGIIWGLSRLFVPEMTWEQIFAFAAGTQVISQYIHSGKKMIKS